MKVIDYNNGYIDDKILLLLGYFDGMHVGHQKLLQRARELAEQKEYKIAIMTFSGNKEEEVIYTFEERVFTFEKLNIDYCIVAEFNENFRKQSSENFIKKLTEICNLKGVVCGSDFTFGYGASDGVQALQQICKKYNLVPTIEALQSDEGQTVIKSAEKNTTVCGKIDRQKISTSTIKQKLKSGELAEVERLLGDKYFIMGKVVAGNQIGRTINFPTANINLAPQKVVLKNGVYAVHVQYKSQIYKGIANLGQKPTVNGSAKLLEVHIFDFQQDIYQEEIVVYFDKFIREIQKFENLQQLKNQIKKDIEQI